MINDFNSYLLIQVRKYLSNRILKNIVWLFFDRFFRLGVGLFVGIWVAKYLGPNNFGKWNYAVAIVSILSAFSTLGLDQVLVKNLIENNTQENKLIGTSFFLRFFGSILAICISCGYVNTQNNEGLLLITFFSGLIISFQCFDVIDLKFQSVLKSRVSVIIKNSVFVLCSILKLFAIHQKSNLIIFVVISLMEIILGSIGLIMCYGITQVINWRLDLKYARLLLNECWPLVLSGIIILLYMRLDQIMIGKMLNLAAVGLYSVSVKFSELWYFIPSVFANSFFPKLIEIKKDLTAYRNLSLSLFKILFVISFSIAICLSIFAPKIILILYGSSFLISAFALQISIWTAIFVFWGVAAGNMLVIENLNKHNLYKSLQGLIINIILNILLIPHLGINGAAIATLISQIYASYFYYLIPKETRHIFYLQTRSILFFL